ncbi:hypothetical protein SAMN05216251_12751 [Actinacidiphila alni]|uniref:Uncharacterized protein n=1 Tax=Actinacidiphila alni TaxID=380248 RepID=A0A1I2L9K9_9ACTN|nr:hypothetical protein [Actinacidiphila alni]SFF75160.1 hypothetical protein SAMN05216251_12751 [Actinacidiphila alni]
MTLNALLSTPVLELDLSGGEMRVLDWLSTVRTAADAGVRHLVLTGPSPARHHAVRSLEECGFACGMHVEIIPKQPTQPADHAPRVRIGSDGIPRMLLPDGIPLSDLLTAIDAGRPLLERAPVLRSLEASGRPCSQPAGSA